MFRRIVNLGNHLPGGHLVSHIKGQGDQFPAERGADIHLKARPDPPVHRKNTVCWGLFDDQRGHFRVAGREQPIAGDGEGQGGQGHKYVPAVVFSHLSVTLTHPGRDVSIPS